MHRKCVLQPSDNLAAAGELVTMLITLITMGDAADFQELNQNTMVTWRRFAINVCQLGSAALKNGQNTAQF
jgi:hypothetical protein